MASPLSDSDRDWQKPSPSVSNQRRIQNRPNRPINQAIHQQRQSQQLTQNVSQSKTMPTSNTATLVLIPTNSTFNQKVINLADKARVRIGRQTNPKTVPTQYNGYFDSKVLSRVHAEIWNDGGRLLIKDLKSSNGTFLNDQRLSPEGTESEPTELQPGDKLEFGIDIVGDDNRTVIHQKVSTEVKIISSSSKRMLTADVSRPQVRRNRPDIGGVRQRLQNELTAALNTNDKIMFAKSEVKEISKQLWEKKRETLFELSRYARQKEIAAANNGNIESQKHAENVRAEESLVTKEAKEEQARSDDAKQNSADKSVTEETAMAENVNSSVEQKGSQELARSDSVDTDLENAHAKDTVLNKPAIVNKETYVSEASHKDKSIDMRYHLEQLREVCEKLREELKAEREVSEALRHELSDSKSLMASLTERFRIERESMLQQIESLKKNDVRFKDQQAAHATVTSPSAENLKEIIEHKIKEALQLEREKIEEEISERERQQYQTKLDNEIEQEKLRLAEASHSVIETRVAEQMNAFKEEWAVRVRNRKNHRKDPSNPVKTSESTDEFIDDEMIEATLVASANAVKSPIHQEKSTGNADNSTLLKVTFGIAVLGLCVLLVRR
ncbi:1892_t:CDS:2 [Paraglomus occultum]|uniref:1892_t:CDS:1 n=1 Tax=Paraglomus occultum TaxID=144539 RepID=A0A9N9CGT3_9GLOM|nr:1892_t:CDS:2 [Paraglomus occultum]